MNSDQLVDTCARESGASASEVRAILAEANLVEDPPPAQPAVRIDLRSVRIEGRRGDGGTFVYRRDLGPGVWVWIAPNFKGKTTILRCIQWALTGDSGALGTKDWIAAAELVFAVDSVVHRLTFQRGQRHEGKLEQTDAGEWTTLESFTSEAAHQRVTQAFFESRLGLARLEFVQRQAKSIKTTVGNVNWSTYARALFLDEHEYGELLLPAIWSGEQSQKILSAFLGLPYLVLLNRAEFALDRATLDRERAELTTAAAGGEPKLAEERQRLRDELERIRTELAAEPAQTELASALRALEQTKVALQGAVVGATTAEDELQAREQTLAAARAEDQMLQDAIVFRQFFNGIEVSHCPRCEQPVEPDARQRERDSGTCRVCSREVPKSNEQRLTELVQQRQELAQEIVVLTRERDAADKRVATAERRQQTAKSAWQHASDAVRAAASGGAELLELRDRLNQELGGVQSTLARIEIPGAAAIDMRRRVLRAAVDALRKAQRSDASDVIDAFCASVLELGRRVGLVTLDQVEVNERGTIRFIDQGRERAFAGFSPGARLRLKIAVLLALALLPTKTKIARHPRLLLIDSPAQHEMVDPDIAALAAFLKSLEDDPITRDSVQILLASAEPGLSDATVAAKAETRNGALF